MRSRDDAARYLTSRLQPVHKLHDTVYDFVRDGKGHNPVMGYINYGKEHTLYQIDRGAYCFDVRPEPPDVTPLTCGCGRPRDPCPGEYSDFPNGGSSLTFQGLIERLLDAYWPPTKCTVTSAGT
ncbi:MAG: hypothetical protein EOO40_05380 [Deltaproteobacteria bacterium]|nr:MAG: hypothetical protein EOO40_05380 [Deltaproteobacteria bacterium]